MEVKPLDPVVPEIVILCRIYTALYFRIVEISPALYNLLYNPSQIQSIPTMASIATPADLSRAELTLGK